MAVVNPQLWHSELATCHQLTSHMDQSLPGAFSPPGDAPVPFEADAFPEAIYPPVVCELARLRRKVSTSSLGFWTEDDAMQVAELDVTSRADSPCSTFGPRSDVFTSSPMSEDHPFFNSEDDPLKSNCAYHEATARALTQSPAAASHRTRSPSVETEPPSSMFDLSGDVLVCDPMTTIRPGFWPQQSDCAYQESTMSPASAVMPSRAHRIRSPSVETSPSSACGTKRGRSLTRRVCTSGLIHTEPRLDCARSLSARTRPPSTRSTSRTLSRCSSVGTWHTRCPSPTRNVDDTTAIPKDVYAAMLELSHLAWVTG
jgi:hypothetical protein